MSRQPAVYIMASNRNGTLYISVARHLAKRVWEHKNDLVEGFRGGLVCLNSAARFDKWNRAAVR